MFNSGMAQDYLLATVPSITAQTVKKMREGGLVPSEAVWKINLRRSQAKIEVNAYYPGVYCLPPKHQ